MKKIKKGQMLIINNNTYLRKEAETWKEFSNEEKLVSKESKNRTIVILGINKKNKIIATSTTSGKKRNGGSFYPSKFSYKDINENGQVNTYIKFQVIEFDFSDIEGKYKYFRRLKSKKIEEFHKNFNKQNPSYYKFLLKKLSE